MNNLFYALPIGLAKILLGLIYIITLWQAIAPSGKSASAQRENRTTAFIITALMTGLLYKLMNGQEVYALKGWTNPQEEQEQAEQDKVITK